MGLNPTHPSTLCAHTYKYTRSRFIYDTDKRKLTCMFASKLLLYTCTLFSHYIILFIAGVWSCPATTGEKPPPCAGLTFIAIDDRRAVLFGGNNGEQGKMNDIYIIDLHSMVCVTIQHYTCTNVIVSMLL